MELREALLARRSVRAFTEEPVPDEMIDELMHAAMSGPSACNVRPWEFYVITDEAKRKELRKVTLFTRHSAPLIIAVCGRAEGPVAIAKDFWVQDCSAATENILLRVTDLGLGAVWCGIWPNNAAVEKVRAVLDLSKKLLPLNLIFIGHPAEEPEPRDQYDASRIHRI